MRADIPSSRSVLERHHIFPTQIQGMFHHPPHHYDSYPSSSYRIRREYTPSIWLYDHHLPIMVIVWVAPPSSLISSSTSPPSSSTTNQSKLWSPHQSSMERDEGPPHSSERSIDVPRCRSETHPSRLDSSYWSPTMKGAEISQGNEAS